MKKVIAFLLLVMLAFTVSTKAQTEELLCGTDVMEYIYIDGRQTYNQTFVGKVMCVDINFETNVLTVLIPGSTNFDGVCEIQKIGFYDGAGKEIKGKDSKVKKRILKMINKNQRVIRVVHGTNSNKSDYSVAIVSNDIQVVIVQRVGNGYSGYKFNCENYYFKNLQKETPDIFKQ